MKAEEEVKEGRSINYRLDLLRLFPPATGLRNIDRIIFICINS